MIIVSSRAGMAEYRAGKLFTIAVAWATANADFSSALHVVDGAGALNSGGTFIGALGGGAI